MEWTQRLRIRQLHLLVALYETRNVSHTAARLNMTQPALSKWLGELETDMGAPLFERHPKGLLPTAFCDGVIRHARAILAEIERTQRSIALMLEGASGDIEIGANPSLAATIVARGIHAFRVRYPDVHITLREGAIGELMPLLLDGRLDLLVARLSAQGLHGDLHCDTLFTDSLHVVVSPRHPLASHAGVTWADTRGYRWVLPVKGGELDVDLQLELALAAEAPPRVQIESRGLTAMAALLQDDQFLGVMTRRAAEWFTSRGLLVSLPLPYRREGPIGMLRLRSAEMTPVRAAMREAILSQVEPGQAPSA